MHGGCRVTASGDRATSLRVVHEAAANRRADAGQGIRDALDDCPNGGRRPERRGEQGRQQRGRDLMAGRRRAGSRCRCRRRLGPISRSVPLPPPAQAPPRLGSLSGAAPCCATRPAPQRRTRGAACEAGSLLGLRHPLRRSPRRTTDQSRRSAVTRSPPGSPAAGVPWPPSSPLPHPFLPHHRKQPRPTSRRRHHRRPHRQHLDATRPSMIKPRQPLTGYERTRPWWPSLIVTDSELPPSPLTHPSGRTHPTHLVTQSHGVSQKVHLPGQRTSAASLI
jgi:hypothetical protein